MKQNQHNSVRIIGGKWRSRKITFVAQSGLRPTQDRIRETLFNWLAPVVDGALCLDLFAGSGALGFEALSRGAQQVYFVDTSSTVADSIHANAQQFLVQSRVTMIRQPCPSASLSNRLERQQFDLVFLDPPYRSDLLLPSLNWLHCGQTIKPKAKIYVEYERALTLSLPTAFKWLKKNRPKHYVMVCWNMIDIYSFAQVVIDYFPPLQRSSHTFYGPYPMLPL